MSGVPAHARRGRLTAAAASVLVLAGALLLVIGARSQQHPPQPPAAAAIPFAASQPHSQPAAQPSSAPAQSSSAPAQSSSATARPPARSSRPATGATASASSRPNAGPVLGRSFPVQLEIPQIQVRTQRLQLGLNADQTVQTPPLVTDDAAGWYKYSPTPGELGPAVILGHVDSAEYGPGVFFELGALRPGATLSVTRADRSTAVFRVDRVVSYPKDQFPTLEVYGNTDTAQLRLVTCGGKFDPRSHKYQSNVVAFATLVSSHPA